MKLKVCTVLRADINYSIGSNSFTKKGFGILSMPNFTLSINASPQEIVKCIFLALDANNYDVPNPEDLKILQEEGAKLMGFSSSTELHKRSKCVIIELVEGMLLISPTKNYVRSEAYDFLGKLKEKIRSDSSLEEIFFALNRAFNKCC